MRSARAYTNVTFTKRVDHEAGRHRPARSPKGRLVCRHCGAVYFKRRWVPRTDERMPLLAAKAEATLCPACDMEAKGLVRGYLTLEGPFFVAHRPEIETLLRNEAGREGEDNPTGRVIAWDTAVKNVLTLATSTEHLAVRLGHAVHKAFKGSIHSGFAHEDKFVRVTWSRE